jgi:hypothetical protein
MPVRAMPKQWNMRGRKQWLSLQLSSRIYRYFIFIKTKNNYLRAIVYAGSVCEWDISVCNETGTERCLNGGACVEGPGERFWCICAPGWGGAICEEPLDPCLILQPCLHGGLCLPRDTDFICACPFGEKL